VIWNYSSTEESCEESGRLQFHRLVELLQTGHKGTLDITINNYQKNNKKRTGIPIYTSSENPNQRKPVLYSENLQRNN
jgi:hypothetical protein